MAIPLLLLLHSSPSHLPFSQFQLRTRISLSHRPCRRIFYIPHTHTHHVLITLPPYLLVSRLSSTLLITVTNQPPLPSKTKEETSNWKPNFDRPCYFQIPSTFPYNQPKPKQKQKKQIPITSFIISPIILATFPTSGQLIKTGHSPKSPRATTALRRPLRARKRRRAGWSFVPAGGALERRLRALLVDTGSLQIGNVDVKVGSCSSDGVSTWSWSGREDEDESDGKNGVNGVKYEEKKKKKKDGSDSDDEEDDDNDDDDVVVDADDADDVDNGDGGDDGMSSPCGSSPCSSSPLQQRGAMSRNGSEVRDKLDDDDDGDGEKGREEDGEQRDGDQEMENGEEKDEESVRCVSQELPLLMSQMSEGLEILLAASESQSQSQLNRPYVFVPELSQDVPEEVDKDKPDDNWQDEAP